MKILMLSATFPYPPTRGGTQVRTFNLMKYLSQHHDITLVTQRGKEVTDAEIEGLRQWVSELVVFPRPSEAKLQSGAIAKLQRFATFVGQGTPPGVLSGYSLPMQEWIDQHVQAGKCEVITCEHSVNEIYVKPEFQERVRTVVNVHSSVYGTCLNQLETKTAEKLWRDRLNLPLLKRYERRYCTKFKHIVVTTEEDQRQLEAFNPQAKFQVIANGVDLAAFPYRAADVGEHRLIFIGAMDNLANIDAAKFLSLEILPVVQQRYPAATLALVGNRPVPEVKALGNCAGVTVTGQVPSMADCLHQATICVIPMRTGFGIKNKTLEAMAAGVPVVASNRGLEGLTVDGANVPLRALRANSVAEYVSAISQLFENPTLRAELSQNARLMIETDYTWERAGQLYEQALLQA